MNRVLGVGQRSVVLLLGAVTATAAGPKDPKRADEVVSVAFSRDGREAASLGKDGTVRVWDVSTGRERKRASVGPGKDEVPRRVIFAPKGVAVLLDRYTGFRFDAATGVATQGTISACLWGMSSGQRSPAVETGYGGVAVCPSGEFLAYANGLWEVGTGKKVRAFTLPGGLVYRLEFAPDGKSLAFWVCDSLAQNQSLILVLEVSTAKKLLQVGAFDERLAGGFRSAPVFSTDGRAIAFAGPNLSQVHVWNVVTGKAVQTVRVGLGNKVVGLPSGGKTVLTWASGEGRVRQWDAATGQELRAVEVGTGVSAVTLSPGGETLAVAKGSLVEFRSLRE